MPGLAEHFRVVTYDRRGPGSSGLDGGCGTIEDDVEDLAALITERGLGRAHIVGGSYGASISLRFAATHPELVLSLNVHEPPLAELLMAAPDGMPLHREFLEAMGRVRAELEAGRDEAGARTFLEWLLPGMWASLPPAMREPFAAHGATFLCELNDVHSYVTEFGLKNVKARTLLTNGSDSPPFFEPIVRAVANGVPGATRHVFEGAGHVPQQSHSDAFVETATRFAHGD
jgi:pimeloyl-ACP methyl ester carboxylesterase